jgi:hypothetical protein
LAGRSRARLASMGGSIVRQIEVPPAARKRSTLTNIGYEDASLVETGPAQDLTAEQWVRAILEGAPATTRSKLRSGWRALGLKLGSSPPERFVLGWEVRQSTAAFVLLGAASRIGMPAELLLERRRRTLLFCTFVQHENLVARAVWAGVEPVHKPIVRSILERAA